jgi:hypothetical protein
MKEILVRVEYQIGDDVFFLPAPEPHKGMVLAYVVGPSMEPEYIIRWEDMSVSQHTSLEISNERAVY